MNYLISQNIKIKGLVFDCEEIKLCQFADDTTLILDGSKESLEAALNTIEIFGTKNEFYKNQSSLDSIFEIRQLPLLN